MLLKQAAVEYKWNLQYGNIALMWRGGCIIRSVFLGNIKEAYDKNPNLPNLMLDPWFTNKLRECSAGWRRVVALGIEEGADAICGRAELLDDFVQLFDALPSLEVQVFQFCGVEAHIEELVAERVTGREMADETIDLVDERELLIARGKVE